MLGMERNSHFQGVHKTSAGYKLMASMGWKEGDGLGAQKQGIGTHVKVSKKADNSGIGVAQEAAKARDWTIGMSAYDKLLAALKPKTETLNSERKSGKKRKREIEQETISSKEQPDSESTDVKEASKQKAKRKRAKSQPSERTTDSRIDGQAAGSMKVSVKRVTHAGRFQKRARNKLVAGYSITDLSAILGERTAEQAEGPVSEQASPAFESEKQSTKVVVIEDMSTQPVTDTPAEAVSDGSDVAETGPLWWHGYFMQAGGAGAQNAYSAFQPVQREVHISGFSEQDQANLWQNATDAQNKNKQGLGQGSSLKKVAGARWEGKRTVIVDREAEQPPSQKGTPPSEPSEVTLGQLKASKKLAKKLLLATADKRMRLKEFKQKLREGLAGCEERCGLKPIIERLGNSRHFTMDKKWIALES